jgi:FtsH-binding integral membrane protein
MAVRCGTCGLVAYYTPDRCPRCGGGAFAEVEAAAGGPEIGSGSTALGLLLVLIAMGCMLAGVLMLAVDAEATVRFFGFMTGVGLAGLCLGMIVLVMRPPPG